VNPEKLDLAIYRGSNGFQELEPLWDKLSDALPSAALSQLSSYYHSFVQAFEPGNDALIFAAVKDKTGRIVAIVPLRYFEKRVFSLKVCGLGFPELPMPIRDALVAPGVSPARVLDFVLDEIGGRLEKRWDYVVLNRVLESSDLLHCDTKSIQRPVVGRHVGFSHLLDVSEPGYVEKVLNSKARNNLKRNQKKLEAIGNFRFATFDSQPEIDDAFESFLTTEAAGWKSVRGGKRAVKLHADQTAFYRDLMHRNSDKGRCQIHLLYLNDQPIASDFCIISRRACYSLKHGYDEKYSNIAPGNLLMAYTMEYYGQSDAVDCIDLISGMQWHLAWRPIRRKVFDIRIFNQSPGGLLLYYLYKIKNARE